MRSYIWATALAAAKANFADLERDGDSDHPVYYSDDVSTYRIPGWMKDPRYAGLLNSDGLQVDGAWNSKNSIIDLGNGVVSGTTKGVGTDADGYKVRNVQGSSTFAQAEMIAAVRAYHEARSGVVNNGISREPNPNDGNSQVWDHIRNFWYRDGDIFALMVDDNACDMMHPPQRDISLDNNDEANELKFNIEDESHHLEHLRDFCIRMGGSLWAPSSQEEYDDLFERDQGVCAKHIAGW